MTKDDTGAGRVKELEGNRESVEVGPGPGSLGSQSRALSKRLEKGSAVRSGPSHRALRAVLGQEGPRLGLTGGGGYSSHSRMVTEAGAFCPRKSLEPFWVWTWALLLSGEDCGHILNLTKPQIPHWRCPDLSSGGWEGPMRSGCEMPSAEPGTE